MKNLKKISTSLSFVIPAFAFAIMPITVSAFERNSEKQSIEVYQYSEAELEQILAPIALYPDTLLSHILIASTYPLEVIEAERFLAKHEDASKEEIAKKVNKKEWDESVKALTNFPRILNQLSEDLAWLQKLASAFLANEEAVLASIQSLRHQADVAGNLEQLSQLKVEREKEIIVIRSPSPDVIYVPYYDTRVVYGHWRWHHYPPVYWHAPAHISYHHGPFYWHSGVRINVGFFFSAFHWHNRHVVIHRHKHRYYSKRYYAKRTTSHEVKRWRHKSHHYNKYHHRNKYLSKRAISAYGKNKHTVRHISKPYVKAKTVTGVKSHASVYKKGAEKHKHLSSANKHKTLKNKLAKPKRELITKKQMVQKPQPVQFSKSKQAKAQQAKSKQKQVKNYQQQKFNKPVKKYDKSFSQTKKREYAKSSKSQQNTQYKSQQKMSSKKVIKTYRGNRDASKNHRKYAANHKYKDRSK